MVEDVTTSPLLGDPTGVFWVVMHATPENQPAPLTPERLLTGWTWDWWIVIPALLALGLYLWGVQRLHARGDRWPVGRTVAWCLGGVGSGVIATMSSLGTYDTVLISVHMVQHMILAMFTPIFLALGAPVTLMLRTFPPRPRGWVLAVLHSRIAKILTFPVLTTAVFIINPYALYFSQLYPLTLESTFWHNWLHLHFVLTGCLFFWPILGIDPMPNRLSYPFRLIMIFVTIPFHSFLGVTIMGSPSLLGEAWYLSFERTWGPSLLDDQYLGGAIMWATSDVVLLVIMAVLFVQWFRASEREARREDRRLDRLERQQHRATMPSQTRMPPHDRSPADRDAR